jgi:preprotein translocase subunit YajC
MTHSVETPFWMLLAAENGGGGMFGILAGPMFPIIIIFVLFYFMLIRPEKRRRSTTNQMLAQLKKSDQVVTAGGVKGTIVNVQPGSDEVTLKVDESNNTKLRVLRSSIARVIRDDETDAKSDMAK